MIRNVKIICVFSDSRVSKCNNCTIRQLHPMFLDDILISQSQWLVANSCQKVLVQKLSEGRSKTRSDSSTKLNWGTCTSWRKQREERPAQRQNKRERESYGGVRQYWGRFVSLPTFNFGHSSEFLCTSRRSTAMPGKDTLWCLLSGFRCLKEGSWIGIRVNNDWYFSNI